MDGFSIAPLPLNADRPAPTTSSADLRRPKPLSANAVPLSTRPNNL